MKPTTAAPASWSGRRWLITIGVVLAGQVSLVFWLSDRPSAPPITRPAPRLIQFAGDPRLQPTTSEAPWLADPAQFALVSAEGFSGPVWLRLPQFQRPAKGWSEPPDWLTQEVVQLGAGVRSLTPPAPTGMVTLAEKPASVFTALPKLRPTSATNSIVQVEGDLARRRLLTPLDVPRWAHNDVLLPTRVQVMVGANGVVQAATLLTRSGLPLADQRALELARAAAFEAVNPPAQGSGLTWGTMIFRWQHLEAGATDASGN
jgi:TonB family protein